MQAKGIDISITYSKRYLKLYIYIYIYKEMQAKELDISITYFIKSVHSKKCIIFWPCDRVRETMAIGLSVFTLVISHLSQNGPEA